MNFVLFILSFKWNLKNLIYEQSTTAVTNDTISKNNSYQDGKFKEPRLFFGYSIIFLRKPITFQFKEPVTLKTCKFGYLLKEIHEDDVSELDSLLSIIPVPVSFDPDSFFIKKINKWNIFNSKGKRIQSIHQSENKVNIDIKILGYKQNSKEISTPMMEINRINIIDLDFSDVIN